MWIFLSFFHRKYVFRDFNLEAELCDFVIPCHFFVENELVLSLTICMFNLAMK